MNPYDDSYTKSLEAFLEEWQVRQECIGAMLVGSFASGLQNNFSDIDVYLILDENTSWRERGDKKYGDFLVEYNAHPISYIEEQIRNDRAQGKRHCLRKVASGIIQFDKIGSVKALQKRAQKYMTEPLPQQRDSEWVEMSKYYMWDLLDNLRDLNERKDAGFSYAYFAGVAQVVDLYSKFLGAEVPRPVRAHSFFSDEMFCRKYGIEPFPDKKFSDQVVACMQGPVIRSIEELIAFVTTKMGGLEIDGWRLRANLQ